MQTAPDRVASLSAPQVVEEAFNLIVEGQRKTQGEFVNPDEESRRDDARRSILLAGTLLTVSCTTMTVALHALTRTALSLRRHRPAALHRHEHNHDTGKAVFLRKQRPLPGNCVNGRREISYPISYPINILLISINVHPLISIKYPFNIHVHSTG